MGGSGSREKASCRKKEKTKIIMGDEMRRVMEARKQEAKAREKERMVFASKEQAWRRERKKMKEEAKLLRKMVEDKEERREAGESGYLMEQLKEERARRDETVLRWKQLYLDIKRELDQLILRTHNGLPPSLDGIPRNNPSCTCTAGSGVCCCRAEELVEGLMMELEEKKEAIEALQAKLDSLEQERRTRERDRDILRQSLRIMSGKEASRMKMKIAVKQKHAQTLP